MMKRASLKAPVQILLDRNTQSISRQEMYSVNEPKSVLEQIKRHGEIIDEARDKLSWQQKTGLAASQNS